MHVKLPARSSALFAFALLAWVGSTALAKVPEPAGAGYDLTAYQTLSRVVSLVRENYVEPERINPYDMFLAALDHIQRSVPEVIIDDKQAPARIAISVGHNEQVFEFGPLEQIWEVIMALRDVFHFLQAHIQDPNEQRNITYAAANGMLSTLDPHSVLLRPESFEEMRMSTRGEFGGLGIVISLRDGALTIISPIEGTPASNAGLRAKDKIVKIGEESTVNMGLDEAVQRLRGEPDSTVDISVLRKGWTEAKPFTLTRAIIKIESVSGKLLDDGVGYIKIKSFQGNTYQDLQTHLEALKKQNNAQPLRGLVLDLRNNPGGLLDQAILVSDRFIERGPLVITVGEGGRRREVRNARMGPDEMSYPIAVLINGGSASASEIVTGALKNHNRAVVIGQQSFGKGSVQVLYDNKDRSALKLTVAQYLTPGDLSIQSRGVTPDLIVEPATIEPSGLHLFIDEEMPREKDLAKHLEQHGLQKLTESSSKLLHLVRETSGQEPNAEAELDKSLALATGAFAYDFEVELAHDLLRGARSLTRPQVLLDGAALLAKKSAEQDARITERMRELGIDWQPGPQAKGGQARLTLSTNAVQGVIEAGQTLRLSAEVHNVGKVAMHRLWASTQSDNPLLKNLEFAFGTVLPGQKKQWSQEIKLPKDLVARADEVVLRLGDANDVQSEAGRVFLTITEQKKPEFEITARLLDDEGNNDGCLQAGESVTLSVDVKNVGKGLAEDTVVIAKNLSGQSIFLASGRATVGSLLPGQSKRAELKFQVYGKATAAKAESEARQEGEERTFAAPKAGDVLQMRILVWDGALGASLSEKLDFVVAPPAAYKPLAQPYRPRGTDEVALLAGACAHSSPLAFAPAGAELTGVGVVGDYVRLEIPGVGRVFAAKARLVEKTGKAFGKQGSAATAVRVVEALGAPRIHLEPTALIVNHEEFHLRGHVEDPRALKDMFVFVGEKKVYFRYLSDGPKEQGRFVTHFDVPLRLSPGTNAIALFVREDDETIARRAFFVHRTEVPVVATPAALKAP